MTEHLVVALMCGVLLFAATALGQADPTATPRANSAASAERPPGTPMLPADSAAAFHLSGVVAQGRCEVVDVVGQSFGKALRVETLKQPEQPWLLQLTSGTTAPVETGDVLLATFQARGVQPATGEACANFIFEMGGAPFTKSAEFPVSVGREWRRFQVPFVSRGSYAAGAANVNFQVGFPPQTIEIAEVSVVNFGQRVKVSDLPRTACDYPGRSPDAPWRQAAAERIEKLRKGDLAVTVIDQSGRPVEGAEVSVKMTRHAFAFGSAVDARWLTDTSADGRQYQEFVGQHFNRVVFENDLKWPPWEDATSGRWSRQRTMAAADWLRQRGIAIRGHCLVWPNWQNLPADLAKLGNDKQALALRVADHITEEVAAMKGRLVEWDVINEPYSNHELMDVLGPGAMAEWFKLAHAADPAVKLFINDYSILSNGGLDAVHQDHYEQTIRFLLDQGAGVQGIGLQGHFGWRLTGPERMLAILDRFAKLGLTLEVTEFDVNITDEQLQADFTRDFYTLLFSHPAVEGILTWGFWQKAHWLPDAAMVRPDWTLKPNGQVWMNLVHKQWSTNAQGRTNSDGRYATRGFLGEYEVTVSAGGKSQVIKAALPKAGAALRVVLK